MKNHQLFERVENEIGISDINQRYHQILEWRWGFADKLIRIAVGILAVSGVAMAPLSLVSMVFGIISALFAVALNVVPTGEREKFYGEMFHRWSGIRRAAERLHVRVSSRADDKDAQSDVVDRLAELVETQHELNAVEPAPFRGLLQRCQENFNESRWGQGVRTEEQVIEARTNSEQQSATESKAVAEEASAAVEQG